jgi:hypothetical protein
MTMPSTTTGLAFDTPAQTIIPTFARLVSVTAVHVGLKDAVGPALGESWQADRHSPTRDVVAQTVIDFGKGIDKAMTIKGVRLIKKAACNGGDYRAGRCSAMTSLRIASFAVSDGYTRGETIDTYGGSARAYGTQLQTKVAAFLSHERSRVSDQLRGWVNRRPTPDLILHRCYETTPRAYLSRGEAEIPGRILIFDMAGSQRGAAKCRDVLLRIIPHAIETLRGEVRGDGRSNVIFTTGTVIQHKDS